MTSAEGAGDGRPGTPLIKKIGIKPGSTVRLVHRPGRWEVPGLPEGCGIAGADLPDADVSIAFYRALDDLAAEAAGLVAALADTAMRWIAWPRRAAGHDGDITENALREVFLPLGVVDVKVAALGADWSGLKFVRRRRNRRSG